LLHQNNEKTTILILYIMKGITFTTGLIEVISTEYCNITLFNKDIQVYKATINKYDATDLFLKYNNIQFPELKNIKFQ